MCFTGVRVQYDFVFNSNGENLFESNINSVTAYVFDQDSLFYGAYSDQGAHLTNTYTMDIPLEAGNDYYIVAWAGKDKWSYSVGQMIDAEHHIFIDELRKGGTKMSDFRLMVNNYLEGEENELYLVENPTDLYYGYHDKFHVELRDFTPIKNISFIKNTNTIKVNVEGIQYISPESATYKSVDSLNIYCVARNGRYKYDNTIGEFARSITYLPPFTQLEDDIYRVELKTMRLVVGDNPTLVIKDDNDNILLEKDIVSQILNNPEYNDQEDLDREDTFEFDIKIDAQLNVAVFINGWEVIEIDPDI